MRVVFTPADRDADERDGRRHPRRPRRSSSSATTSRCCKDEGRARSSAVVKAIPGAADVDDRADHRPAGAADRGRPRRARPPRRPGARGARRRRGARRHRRRRGAGGRAAVPARRPARRCATATTRGASAAILIPTAVGRARCRCRGSPTIEIVEGPSTIQREWGQRRIVVQANVRGRDIGSFVAEAQARDRPRGRRCPPGYYDRVGRPVREPRARRSAAADRRAGRPGPDLRACSTSRTARVARRAARLHRRAVRARSAASSPCGSRDMPFSISAGVGFVALSGVAVLDDMVLVSYDPPTAAAGRAAARGGRAGRGSRRLRPVLMTGAGREPRLRADGAHHRHRRRGAAAAGDRRHRRRPVDTLLTLLVLPVLYLLFAPPRPAVREGPLAPEVRR